MVWKVSCARPRGVRSLERTVNWAASHTAHCQSTASVFSSERGTTPHSRFSSRWQLWYNLSNHGSFLSNTNTSAFINYLKFVLLGSYLQFLPHQPESTQYSLIHYEEYMQTHFYVTPYSKRSFFLTYIYKTLKRRSSSDTCIRLTIMNTLYHTKNTSHRKSRVSHEKVKWKLCSPRASPPTHPPRWTVPYKMKLMRSEKSCGWKVLLGALLICRRMAREISWISEGLRLQLSK